jgi:Tfp pilus assembly protein PilO
MNALNLKNRQHLLTIITVTLVALFAADKLLVGPLTASWKQRATRIGDLRKQVNDGQQLLRRRQALHARWDYMRTNTLPNNPSLAEQQVFNAFDRWSQDSRISITSISPQWKHDADDFITLECRVEATGNLSTLSKFLYEIEKDPIALKLENMEISARDTEGQVLALGLQLSGLVLTPTDAKQ